MQASDATGIFLAAATLSMPMSLVSTPALAEIVPAGQQDGGEAGLVFESEETSSRELDERRYLEDLAAIER